MNSRISPFAALTGEEKQIKWLEYQSIRLPYVQGSVDSLEEVGQNPSQAFQAEEAALPSSPRSAEEKPVQSNPPNPSIKKQTPPQIPSALPGGAPNIDFQKTRHRQYDAVIARMKQAEQNAKTFQALS